MHDHPSGIRLDVCRNRIPGWSGCARNQGTCLNGEALRVFQVKAGVTANPGILVANNRLNRQIRCFDRNT